MEFLKLQMVENSGIGSDAIHSKVMEAFKRSEAEGLFYCYQRGYKVYLTDILLRIVSYAPFGFKMVALIKR